MSDIDRRFVIRSFLAAAPAAFWQNQSVGNAAQSGIKVAADQDRLGKSRAIGFNTTTFKITADDTQRALFAMEQHSKKPGGPPLHLHHDQDEFWYVASGEYLFQIGSDRFQAKTGDCLLGPREISHAYAYLGPSEGRLLIGFAPAGKIQEYFERPRTPGEYVSDAALYREYGMELLGPPLAVN